MTVIARVGNRSSDDLDLMPQHLDLGTWPTVDELALSEDRRKKFQLRKKAIELYVAGASDSILRKKTELCSTCTKVGFFAVSKFQILASKSH